MDRLKILIPTDFSEQAEFAYLLVANIAAKVPASIHFLHVMDVPDTVTFTETGGFETCGEIDVKTLEIRKSIIDRKLANLKTQYGDDINTHVGLGKLTETIAAFAEHGNFDLVAMGTKGAWGLREKMSGSETQLVARHCKVPVLALKCDRSDLAFKEVLLVHEFNHAKAENLEVMKKIVQAFGSRLHLLQIVQHEHEKVEALAAMDDFAAKNGLENVDKHILLDRDVENGVIHFNQMHDVDMVCIGTHGRSGFAHLVRPSATEKLLNHMFKPIFTFRLN
jgi:nucleotide-binding universal stress UspA family protein